MTTKPTTSHPRPEFPCIGSLSAAYAEMATDSGREAEAEQWLEALSVGQLPDEA
ncbi:MAG TPA: hypothetical protein VKU02_32615 [Gemmataceae bacterium]|nr:hypothetical protein [Gemmataceae bacterium]